MKFRKFALWALLLVASPMAVFAGYGDDMDKKNMHHGDHHDKDMHKDGMYDGGFWLGINHGSMPDTSDWGLMIGWSGDWFLIDLGYNFQYLEFENQADTYQNSLLSHVGVRWRVMDSNLFGTFGAQGSYQFQSDDSIAPDVWSAGAFIGMDYQLSEHFMISAKIAPYTYDYITSGTYTHNVFAQGNIVFAYVF